jgi:hypothetical protein
MNIYDAYKIFGYADIPSLEDINRDYRRLAAKFHPDRNPAGLTIMQAVNEARDCLVQAIESGLTMQQPKEATTENFDDTLYAAIVAVINLEGVILELCGVWLWLTGNTKEHKEAIKLAGYKWSSTKSAWYFRAEEYRSFNRKKHSLDEIRGKHGSAIVRARMTNLIGARA